MRAGVAAVAAPPKETEVNPRSPTPRTSMALPEILSETAGRWSHGVLDLGTATGTNLEFFCDLHPRVMFADLYRSLSGTEDDAGVARTNPWADPLAFDRRCREILPLPGEQTFDLVVAWDLLNYLSQAQMAILMHHLTGLCRPGSLLFALISIRPQIAGRPLDFEIRGPREIAYRGSSARLRPGPHWKEPQILRTMPGFRVRASYLLRHGMQEYVFAYDPPESEAGG